MATTSVLAQSQSPVKQANRRLSRSTAPRTVPASTAETERSSSSTNSGFASSSSAPARSKTIKKAESPKLKPPVSPRLPWVRPINISEREYNRSRCVGVYDDPPTSESERSPSPAPAVSPKMEHISISSESIRTRSKTNSLSPVKRLGQALSASPVKRKLLPEIIKEYKEDTQSVVSAEEESNAPDQGLGLNGMEAEPNVEVGEVPLPKAAKLDAASQAAFQAAAAADRKAAPRRRRKGDVEPETPAAAEARKARHAQIDDALKDLQRQAQSIDRDEHPQLIELFDSLESRRQCKLRRAKATFESQQKEAAHVRDAEVMAARCQWHTACLDLKEKTVRSNIRRAHAARRERTSWQFARLPEYLQVGRIPFDAGAGWRFDPGQLISDPDAHLITFLDDDNVPAKRRRVEQGINGISEPARRGDLERMGVLRPRAPKYDRVEEAGPSRLPALSAPLRSYGPSMNPYGYAPQPHMRQNQLPAEYQTAPDYRDNRSNMPWWQPPTFPSSTPPSAAPPPATFQNHHHHHNHKRHHHHHHARSYPYTSQPPASQPQAPPRPSYYDSGETIAKTNAFYRNLLAS